MMRQYYAKIVIVAFATMLLMGCEEELVLCPDSNHPHVIDLGLPSGTKWACCNVGAPSPEQSGGYYPWGGTEALVVSDESDEKSNYNEPRYEPDISRTMFDVAYMKWGKNWHMPSVVQVRELITYCKSQKYTTYLGIEGFVFVGPNGNSIFIPAAGFMYKEAPKKGFQGFIWTSTNKAKEGDNSFPKYSNCLGFGKGKREWVNGLDAMPHEFGLPIRPVKE